jgi:hypothetical protein
VSLARAIETDGDREAMFLEEGAVAGGDHGSIGGDGELHADISRASKRGCLFGGPHNQRAIQHGKPHLCQWRREKGPFWRPTLSPIVPS